jgi:hypothetical protein
MSEVNSVVAVYGSHVEAGLYGMGIPKGSVVRYEMASKTERFLPIVHSTAAEVEKAKDIIENTRPINVTPHSK